METLVGPVGHPAGFYCDDKSEHALLLREVVGNPFSIPSIDPFWVSHNGGVVRDLAMSMQTTWDFDRMPILADALEDAGCDDQDILNHCRQQPTSNHVRGCWVLDLLLGTE
jgi:hypothetical protein